MGEANEGDKRSHLERLSLEPNRFPRDMLQRFMATNNQREQEEAGEEGSEEVELSLGLSLGGRFGVNKSVGGLVRSSSIASCLPVVRDDDALAPPPPSSYPALKRTSSLPTETEEQRRKRKEMQTLRRMEAKRRRSEKQRNLKIDRDGTGGGGDGGGGSSGGGGGSDRSFEDERAQFEANMRGRDQNTGAANRIPAGLVSRASSSGGRKKGYVGSRSSGGKGSVESQGGGSSISESESKPIQGSSNRGEANAASLHSLQDRSSQKAVGSATSKGKECASKPSVEIENPSKREEVTKKQGRGSTLEDMPSVFTIGDGPNGRRVDGILYKYGKGEGVRIICVCHGRCLSAVEFVKHAGGTDLANPLKHIVINPNADPLL